ncbi:PilT protein domain protein [Fimbriimonas ginsengisoli Gsoil 348]|uniref:PilT protein domain protein n=1 Tax=Fimbriimonas ginsengisoli Gsoil 348 TaxID=661478 RepID=A0A068NVB9_FIMGI|nr:PilT protein domain protein [Fimbriimonas ginsengisoli Gsoil 348]
MIYVLDTNVVLYHLSGRLKDPLPSGVLMVSIITEIELLAFKSLTSKDAQQISAFISGVTVAPLIDALKQPVIDMRLAGLRIPDAIVAATAIANGAELWTHDAQLLKMTTFAAVAPPLKP